MLKNWQKNIDFISKGQKANSFCRIRLMCTGNDVEHVMCLHVFDVRALSVIIVRRRSRLEDESADVNQVCL